MTTKTWGEYAADAEKADYGAHGHQWNFDPSAGAPRLRAFVDGAQLIAYPDGWIIRWSGGTQSDVTGEAESYSDAQRRAHEAYTSLKKLTES